MNNNQNQIGTLSEKSIHSQIKDYLEPDKKYQEVKVGNYIADIKRGNEIFEVQTKNFKNLIHKLDYYIANNYKVTVVYPMIRKKTIYWVDPVSNKVVDIRKSSHTGVIQDVLKEVYWIQDHIVNKEINLKIITLDANEYKYLDGYGHNHKNHATKIDKIPAKIINEININSVYDLKQFIPDTLDKTWTAKEFIKHTKCNKRWAGSGIKLLRDLGIIKVVGTLGRTFIYKLNDF